MKKTNPFPFLFARHGILWLCALRKARMPSGEAARQSFPKTAKVAIGGGDDTPTLFLFARPNDWILKFETEFEFF